MAKRTIAKYFSDLSDVEIESGSPTVHFAFEGTSYEIDLTHHEAEAFRELIAPYTAVARRSVGTRRRPAGTDGPTPKQIRAWAVAQGLDVPARGRIPATITEAYAAAHQS